MNRFKFRAWDRHLSQYIEDLEFLSQGYWSQDGNPIFIAEGESGEYHDCEDSFEENFILQQFTGIKDKNGKEIYEGDILKVEGQLIGSYFNLGNEELPAYPDNKTYTWIAKVVWDDGYASYSMEYIDHPDYSGRGKFNMIGVAPWAEVIGNIFENPELLKKCITKK